ncbi:MAG: hypothetical protein CVU42_15430 [Chloroflexi bacterium HGW-Chloroflexi-4]|nr:MAG: hypothetical protein CVU42_15430 [Chloroflexi bacterium HGW-Chloroflexi-4]
MYNIMNTIHNDESLILISIAVFEKSIKVLLLLFKVFSIFIVFHRNYLQYPDFFSSEDSVVAKSSLALVSYYFLRFFLVKNTQFQNDLYFIF